MKFRVFAGGFVAPAIAAAALFGMSARSAEAQSPFVSPGGPYGGYIGAPMQFTAISNIGPIIGAQWSFGDGTGASGTTVTKVYNAPGTYPVTVTMTNVFGQSFSASTTATVSGVYAFAGVRTFPVVTAPITTVNFPLAGCGGRAEIVNGVYYTCGYHPHFVQTLATVNPNCYALWLRHNLLPASCSLVYR